MYFLKRRITDLLHVLQILHAYVVFCVLVHTRGRRKGIKSAAVKVILAVADIISGSGGSRGGYTKKVAPLWDWRMGGVFRLAGGTVSLRLGV